MECSLFSSLSPPSSDSLKSSDFASSFDPSDPLTIKGIKGTNHTFTTKLYPLQCNYCI
ncbi:predicted protein [Arabidopsis lyrata subsp. lyrata]|uniref:Predicted protein n=1 Tax=Arabidopsis lyrata subsp. lyrata TaxID=81972 RepID=D7MI31_ARALL|nr:predicted protein [Arabidopsis lyrata subsp. lyrata]